MSGETGSSRHCPSQQWPSGKGGCSALMLGWLLPLCPGLPQQREAAQKRLQENSAALESVNTEFGYKRREQVGVKLEKRGEFGWGRGWNTGARCGAGSPSAGERVTNAH